jgi:hypothetical protein
MPSFHSCNLSISNSQHHQGIHPPNSGKKAAKASSAAKVKYLSRRIIVLCISKSISKNQYVEAKKREEGEVAALEPICDRANGDGPSCQIMGKFIS